MASLSSSFSSVTVFPGVTALLGVAGIFASLSPCSLPLSYFCSLGVAGFSPRCLESSIVSLRSCLRALNSPVTSCNLSRRIVRLSVGGGDKMRQVQRRLPPNISLGVKLCSCLVADIHDLVVEPRPQEFTLAPISSQQISQVGLC